MIKYTRNAKYRWYNKRADWKYSLDEAYTHETGILGRAGGDEWVSINAAGLLRIRRGYAWDGASGPAIDTESFMRASLVHDALYQLIRRNVLLRSDRAAADSLLAEIARDDGMWYVRSLWVHAAVAVFGGIVLGLPEDSL